MFKTEAFMQGQCKVKDADILSMSGKNAVAKVDGKLYHAIYDKESKTFRVKEKEQ